MEKRKLVTYGGYGAFGLLCLLLSFYVTFPADALAQRLVHEVQRQTRGGWILSYGSASLYRFSGIELNQVTLKRNLAGSDAWNVQLDAVKGRLRLLPLLLAKVSVDAQLQSGEGTLNARLTPTGKDNYDVHMEADAVDFGSPPLLAHLTGLPVGGKVSGTVDTSWDSDLRKATGDVDVTVEGASVGPGMVAGFTVPTVDLGELALGAEVKDGKFTFTQFKQKGGNISLNLKGNAALRQPVMASNVDVCLQFKADPQFLNSNPKIRSALQIAEVQLKKDGQGFLNVPLSGALSAPRLGNGVCR